MEFTPNRFTMVYPSRVYGKSSKIRLRQNDVAGRTAAAFWCCQVCVSNYWNILRWYTPWGCHLFAKTMSIALQFESHELRKAQFSDKVWEAICVYIYDIYMHTNTCIYIYIYIVYMYIYMPHIYMYIYVLYMSYICHIYTYIMYKLWVPYLPITSAAPGVHNVTPLAGRSSTSSGVRPQKRGDSTNHVVATGDRKNSQSGIYMYGYGSIPIDTIFSGMNIHLPAILMFTRGTRFWPIPIYIYKLYALSHGALKSWWTDELIYIYIIYMFMYNIRDISPQYEKININNGM